MRRGASLLVVTAVLLAGCSDPPESKLDRSSAVSFDSGWWASDRGQDLFGTVPQLSAVLMLLFLLLAVVQGVLTGEPAQMIRAALVEAPLSMLGTVALVAVTTALLAATDGASSLVLAGAPDGLGRFASGFGTTGTLMTNGLLAVILVDQGDRGRGAAEEVVEVDPDALGFG